MGGLKAITHLLLRCLRLESEKIKKLIHFPPDMDLGRGIRYPVTSAIPTAIFFGTLALIPSNSSVHYFVKPKEPEYNSQILLVNKLSICC